jgi:hypothetical protein
MSLAAQDIRSSEQFRIVHLPIHRIGIPILHGCWHVAAMDCSADIAQTATAHKRDALWFAGGEEILHKGLSDSSSHNFSYPYSVHPIHAQFHIVLAYSTHCYIYSNRGCNSSMYA